MLYIFLAVIITGIGIAIWLFLEENKSKEEKKAPSLLERLGLEGSPNATPPLSTAKNPPESIPELNLEFSPKPDLTSPVNDIAINSELESPSVTADPELIAKYERLEMLFKEKSEELEKIEKALANELKTHKEFNKVKDILEKEIKDIKDRNHKLQLEFGAAQAEIDSYKKRSLQLEEKNNARDKEVLQKEEQIHEFGKQLQGREKQIGDLQKQLEDLQKKLQEAQKTPAPAPQVSPQETQAPTASIPEQKDEPVTDAQQEETKPPASAAPLEPEPQNNTQTTETVSQPAQAENTEKKSQPDQPT